MLNALTIDVEDYFQVNAFVRGIFARISGIPAFSGSIATPAGFSLNDIFSHKDFSGLPWIKVFAFDLIIQRNCSNPDPK